MSVGKFELSRTFSDNGEGLDVGYALNFYGRWKFFLELCPLLECAAEAGEEARVVSVLAAGQGKALDAEDLGLKKNWSIPRSFEQGEYSSLVSSSPRSVSSTIYQSNAHNPEFGRADIH